MVYSGMSADQSVLATLPTPPTKVAGELPSDQNESGNGPSTESSQVVPSQPSNQPVNSLNNHNGNANPLATGVGTNPPMEPINNQDPQNSNSLPGGPDSNSGTSNPRGPQETPGQLLPDNPRNQKLAPATESTLTGSQRLQRLGYVWLFSVGGLFLVRTLLDPILVRRPLLDPNLSIGGMVFLGCSLMTFMFADLVTAPVKSETGDPRINGPGYRWLQTLPVIDTFSHRQRSDQAGQLSDASSPAGSTSFNSEGQPTTSQNPNSPSSTSPQLGTDRNQPIDWHGEWAAKTLVIANQIAIVLGLIFLGNYHFSNFRSGVGMACIYLMVPYTVFYSGHPLHLLPGALILWAMVAYRRPFWSGLLIGLAAGVAYYPIFLLPLWFSFYWDKGAVRFAIGVVWALSICILGLWFTAADTSTWLSQVQQMFGFWLPVMEGLRGIWSLGWDANFRLPILVGFLVLAISFVFWPARKNTGTLIAYSAAIMLAVQFWHGFGGGLYMAWYLPLTLATFFRPNLTERDAISQLGDGWLRRFRRTDSKHSIPTAA